jgi:hypothetical protein
MSFARGFEEILRGNEFRACSNVVVLVLAAGAFGLGPGGRTLPQARAQNRCAKRILRYHVRRSRRTRPSRRRWAR